MRAFIDIFVLFVFTLGTIQSSRVISFCKMMDEDDVPVVVCACSEDLNTRENEVNLSIERMACCSIERFDKDKVQDFTTFKDEISKSISTQSSFKNSTIPTEFPLPVRHPTFNIFYLKFKLPILNSSLLI
jgi:hypothetical protein